MTATFKGTALAGLAGAASYLAVEILFRWSQLAHETSRELLENLGWMAFQAIIFAVTYYAITRIIFRRFAYQSNSSKSER